jgi:hypothetical protein
LCVLVSMARSWSTRPCRPRNTYASGAQLALFGFQLIASLILRVEGLVQPVGAILFDQVAGLGQADAIERAKADLPFPPFEPVTLQPGPREPVLAFARRNLEHQAAAVAQIGLGIRAVFGFTY